MKTVIVLLTLTALVALGLFAVNADFAKEELKFKPIPKTAGLFSDACDECLLRIAENPIKLGELKMLLQLLCKEAPESYQDECRLFVANVDKFVKSCGHICAIPNPSVTRSTSSATRISTSSIASEYSMQNNLKIVAVCENSKLLLILLNLSL